MSKTKLPLNHPFRLLRMKRLSIYLDMSRSHIYSLVRAGEFPEPVRISPKISAWKKSDIDAWLQSKEVAL